MQYIKSKFFCILLSCLMLMPALPTAANTPVRQFTFTPIAYAGKILDALPCSNGQFAVKNENFRSGFLGTDGTITLDFEFADAGAFSNALAPAITEGGKFGYINREGLFEIAPAFDSADAFSEGLALVERNARSFYIDKTGREVLLAFGTEYTPVTAFHDGVAWVEDQEGRYRLIDKNGQFKTENLYTWVSPFSDGVCWAEPVGKDNWDFELELLDSDGNVLIPCGTFVAAHSFSEGVCWAKVAGNPSPVLIDKQGQILYTANSTEGFPTPYNNGLSVSLENNLFTIRNTDGTMVFSSFNYRAVSYGGFSEGSMLVQDLRDQKYYILQDSKYAETEKPEENYDFTYAEQTDANTQFEIVLKIGSPFAIVNDNRKYIDEQNPALQTFTLDDRTLVPMRFLSENLPGWSITWDTLSATAVLKSNFLSASFKEDVSTLRYIRFNPETKQYDALSKTLDRPPLNVDGRMFLPVRALSELMEVSVFYDTRGLVVFSSDRKELSEEDVATLLARFEV